VTEEDKSTSTEQVNLSSIDHKEQLATQVEAARVVTSTDQASKLQQNKL